MHSVPEHTTVAVMPFILLFLCFAVKHVVADFYLQPTWMALGKEKANDWAKPLLLHCAIHGGCTTALVTFVRPDLWFLGLVDFAIHLLIDRGKSLILNHKGITQNDRPFWALLGIDQTLHHVTGFALALTVAMA